MQTVGLAEVFPTILTKALFLLETLGPGCLDKLEKDRGAAEAQSPGMGRGRETMCFGVKKGWSS